MSDFILTSQQESAIKKTVEWYKNRWNTKQQVMTISGFAGTGKSSIVKYIIDDLKIDESKVAFVTFTGKAALVLRRKGIPANTIHSTIYRKEEEEIDGEKVITWQKQPYLDFKLIVVDEASMVSSDIMDDLLSYGIAVLFIGDPGQIPPIGNKTNYLDNPDVLLTEIHRQGKDNPIIRLSMEIRSGNFNFFKSGKYADNILILNKTLPPEFLTKADIIIVGTHRLRTEINKQVRKFKGFDNPVFNKGEKVIAKMNNKNKTLFFEGMDIPLCNGMIGYFQNDFDPKMIQHQYVYNDFEKINKLVETHSVQFKPEFIPNDVNKRFEDMMMCTETLKTDNQKPFVGKGDVNWFNYGSAISGHGSQGSEWDQVILYDDWFWDPPMRIKYLYTVITRAQKKLVIKI